MPTKQLDTLYKVFMTDGKGVAPGAPFSKPDAACAILEHGGVIFFPHSPFKFADGDKEFLLSQKQKDADYHKNIAYRPLENRLTGFEAKNPVDAERLRIIMGDFHVQVKEFLQRLLSPYARNWKVDFASYRPIEEDGRKMRLRARNDLLHVDSFATRPIYGDRILRTFINLNPSQNRVWNTSDNFEVLARKFKDSVAPPRALNAVPRKPSPLHTAMRALGLKANSGSAYDSWMLNFHNFLKENSEFQSTTRKDRWEFPPNSSWIVFTDMVSHSVLSGQYALEQTFIISQKDLVCPEKAPINILRRLYGVD
jgi:hypothetical protein